MSGVCILVCAWLCVRHELVTFEGMRESFCWLASQAFSFSSLLVAVFYFFIFYFFECMALGPTVILRTLTCLVKGPKTGGFSHVLGFVGFISILCTRVMVIN